MVFFVFFWFLYLFLVLLLFFNFFKNSFLFDFLLFGGWGLDFSFSFLFDYVSIGFFSSVSFISMIVFFYSNFYMEGTFDLRRFYWLVFGFVSSMFILVFSGNFLTSFVGWDGLGLTSFCLVIFYSNHSSVESGLVTVFSNRVGDVFFLISFLFFFLGGTFSFDSGIRSIPYFFCIIVFLGAITKSAQIPFSAWLPAAMAAPTPVSSLVHSSTLVTAGVYVLVRFFYIFVYFNFNILKIFFLLTMASAGICANLEKDFKKVVAMSTLSQLGMMLFILSVGVWVLTFLHMIIHAFFKSMLFLSTGSLMHNLSGGQDSRFFGGSKLSFFSFVFFVVSCCCLAGFPFYIGFYSKDFIIVSSSFFLGVFYYFMFVIGCLFTVLYSFRLFKSSYCNVLQGYSYSSFSESWIFVFPVLLLFLKSWLIGGLFYWFFLFDGSVFFSGLDLIVGLILISLGMIFKKTISFIYPVCFYFYSISFLRWFKSSGSSGIFKGLLFYKWDFSWLEFFGGQGVYQLLRYNSFYLSIFNGILLGFLLFFLFLFFYSFFF